MSSFVSRWVVLQDHAVAPDDVDANGTVRDDVLANWITNARDEYLDLCRELRERQRGGLLIRMGAVEVPPGALPGRPANVSVSAGATEFFPTSFTMAFRVRSYGSADDTVLNLTCAVALEDP